MATTDKLLSEYYGEKGSKSPDTGRHVRFITEGDGGRNGICHIIETAQKEEEDMLNFTCHVISAIQQTVFGYIMWILSIVLSIAALVIGILRFRSCPCERTIPLFLSVGGTILLLKGLLRGLQRCYHRKPVDERQSLYTVNDILTVLVVFWTMTGTVWVFGTFPRVQLDNPDMPEYCDYLLYWSAFAMVFIFLVNILGWTLLTVSLCIFYNYYDDKAFFSCFDTFDDHNETPTKASKPSVFILGTGNPV